MLTQATKYESGIRYDLERKHFDIRFYRSVYPETFASFLVELFLTRWKIHAHDIHKLSVALFGFQNVSNCGRLSSIAFLSALDTLVLHMHHESHFGESARWSAAMEADVLGSDWPTTLKRLELHLHHERFLQPALLKECCQRSPQLRELSVDAAWLPTLTQSKSLMWRHLETVTLRGVWRRQLHESWWTPLVRHVQAPSTDFPFCDVELWLTRTTLEDSLVLALLRRLLVDHVIDMILAYRC